MDEEEVTTWVKCYNPVIKETYYYSHDGERIEYEPPREKYDTIIDFKDDPMMWSSVKIQGLFRSNHAKKVVNKKRYSKMETVFDTSYIDDDWNVDIVGPNGNIIKRGNGNDKKPSFVFVATNPISSGKTYMEYSIKKHIVQSGINDDAKIEIGFIPQKPSIQMQHYLKKNKILNLTDIPGGFVITSDGKAYKNKKIFEDPLNTLNNLQAFSMNDTIGIGVEYNKKHEGKIFFSKNSVLLGSMSMSGVIKTDLTPAVSVRAAGDEIEFAWCDAPPYELTDEQTKNQEKENKTGKETEDLNEDIEDDEDDDEEDIDDEEILKIVGKYQTNKRPKRSIPKIDFLLGKSSIDQDKKQFREIGYCNGEKDNFLDMKIHQFFETKNVKEEKVHEVTDNFVTLSKRLSDITKKNKREELRKRKEGREAIHNIPNRREEQAAARKALSLQSQKMIHNYEVAFRKNTRNQDIKEKEFEDNRKIIEERREIKMQKKIENDKLSSKQKGKEVRDKFGNNIWETVKAGVPVSALEECIYQQSLQHDPKRQCTEANVTFDFLCKSILDGYVLESSHPYSASGINQSVQMKLMQQSSRASSHRTLHTASSASSKYEMATNKASPIPSPQSYASSKASVNSGGSPNSAEGRTVGNSSPMPATSGKRGSGLVYCNDSPKLEIEPTGYGGSSVVEGRPRSPKYNSYGTCILFDPRCNMVAGKGRVSFQWQEGNDVKESFYYQGSGFFANLKLKKEDNFAQNTGQDINDKILIDSDLPGVGNTKPLFIPSTQFDLKFECNYYNPEDTLISENNLNWGWKILAWAVQSEEHAKLQIEEHVRNVHIQQILASRRPNGDSILHRAALEGNTAAVVYLLKLGVDVNMIDAARIKNTPLHYACKSGNVNTVNRLLQNGADPLALNCWGEIPLHEAARYNHLKIIKRLLKTVKTEQLHTKNYLGATPIMVLQKHKNCQWSYNVLKDLMEGKKRRRKVNMHLLG